MSERPSFREEKTNDQLNSFPIPSQIEHLKTKEERALAVISYLLKHHTKPL